MRRTPADALDGSMEMLRLAWMIDAGRALDPGRRPHRPAWQGPSRRAGRAI